MDKWFRFLNIRIASLCLVIFCADTSDASIACYKIFYGKKKEDGLKVELSFKSNGLGKTNLYVPVLSPIIKNDNSERLSIHPFKKISGIDINNKFDIKTNTGSIKLDKEYKSQKLCAKKERGYCYIVKITHAPNADITINYTIPSSFLSFISKENGVIFAGDAILLPEPPDEQNIAISMEWDALKVGRGKIITHDGVRENKHTISGSVGDILGGWYYFGNAKVSSYTEDKDLPLRITTIGFPEKSTSTMLLNTDIIALTKKIATNNQSFINSVIGSKHNKQKQSIVLFNGNISEFAGSSKANYYIVSLSSDDEMKAYANMISHEFLHQLFGGKISVAFGPKLHRYWYWFDEGWTYYYSTMLNLEDNIITSDQYIDIFNEHIKKYYTTYAPLQKLAFDWRRCTNSELPMKYEADYDMMQNLSGYILASNLDNIIRIKTHGKYKLKDLLKKAVSSCRSIPCNLTYEQFTNIANNLTGSKTQWLSNYFSMYLEDYEVIPPLDTIMGRKGLLIYKMADEVFDIGFNSRETLCSGVASGVHSDGNAYKAGLRNGDKLSHIDISPMNISLIVEKSFSSKKKIKYCALRRKLIPQYIIQ